MAIDTSLIGRRRAFLALGLLLPPVLGAVVWTAQEGRREFDLALSCCVVVVFLIGFLALTELVGQTNPNAKRAAFGYLEVLIGADGYASTSKAVAWLWTLVFAGALLVLSGMTWFSELTAEEAFGQDWNSYLLLLGGPYASAVLAKGIVTGKSGTQAASTTEAASSSVVGTAPDTAPDGPQVSDLATGSSGDTSLPDTQYVVFSLVAIVYFVGALVNALNDYAGERSDVIQLPAIPEALLGLTSLAALTYVGAKVVARNGLRLVSVTPDQATSGTVIQVMVVNASAALTAGMVTVFFRDDTGSVMAPVSPSLDPTRVGAVTTFSVTVPGLTAGAYTLVVSTPDGSTTPTPFTVT